MSAQSMERALDRIRDLSNESLDVASFFTEANEALLRAVPSGAGTSPTPFWYTLDPASLLITSAIGACDLSVDELLRFEYLSDDFNKATDVARNPRGVQTLHEATEGKPDRSRVYRDYMRPHDMEQEALLALRSRGGETWGTVRLVRAPGQPRFNSNELEFLRLAAPYLAEGVRRGLLVGESLEPDNPDSPGVIVLCEDWTVDSLTPGVTRWLSELPGNWDLNGQLPPSVLAVAATALRIARQEAHPYEVAALRVLTRRGRWVVLHGAVLAGNGAGKAAVIVEPTHPAQIVQLMMAVYALSRREQEVTTRVLKGYSTAEIAETLCLSPHTVQQHLKRIFDKTGVRSRRELVGKVFVNHYDLRVRDNQQRILAGKAIRRGPVQGSPSMTSSEQTSAHSPARS